MKNAAESHVAAIETSVSTALNIAVFLIFFWYVFFDLACSLLRCVILFKCWYYNKKEVLQNFFLFFSLFDSWIEF